MSDRQPIKLHNSERIGALVNQLIGELAMDVHDTSSRGSEYVNLLNATLTVVASMIRRLQAQMELSFYAEKSPEEKEMFVTQQVLRVIEEARIDYHIELEDLFTILVANVHVGEKALMKEMGYKQEEIDMIKKAAIMEVTPKDDKPMPPKDIEGGYSIG
jgi:hypothetical protein